MIRRVQPYLLQKVMNLHVKDASEMCQQVPEESYFGGGSENITNLKKCRKNFAAGSSLQTQIDSNNKFRVSAYYSSDRLNIYDVSDISTHVSWTVSFQFLHILD